MSNKIQMTPFSNVGHIKTDLDSINFTMSHVVGKYYVILCEIKYIA